MLSDTERQEIDSEIRHAPAKSAVAIDALKIVQRERGWISGDAIKDIARHLEMTPDELDGVATFYNRIFRKPVGRHVIEVCDSISCWVMGSDSIKDILARRLGVGEGGTTSDGRFTLLPVDCLGACHRAPAAVVDGELHGELDEAKLDEMLGELRAKEP